MTILVIGLLVFCLYELAFTFYSLKKAEPEEAHTVYSDCIVVDTYGSLYMLEEINGRFDNVSIGENEVSEYIDYSMIEIGQILRIYYDGGILEEWPASFSRISNVEILE